MSFFGKNFSISIAIYIVAYIAAANGITTEKWTHDFENSVFVQDRTLLTSQGQVYGNCDPRVVHKDETRISCKIAMENVEAAINSPDHVRMCNFTLPEEMHHSENEHRLDEIVAIAKDRAVLKFRGLSSQKLFVLNFANCTIVNSHTNKNFMFIHAPSNTKFDVIVLKAEDPGVKYRIIFDTDGNIISSEKRWFKRDTNIIAAADSSTKGRLVIDIIASFAGSTLEPSVRINAVTNDGTIESLKEYPIDKRGYYVYGERFAESTTSNLVSLCARINLTMTMKCSQLDLDGNVKFETDISLDEYSPVHSFRLHNLPRGGLLLFIYKCRESAKPVCVLRENSFTIKKINAAGQTVGTLKVNDNHNVISVTLGMMHVFESDKKEVCLSNVRSRSNDWKLTLDVVCLKDDEFSGDITWPTY